MTLLKTLKETILFAVRMVPGIVLLCLFPGIATWLPTALMGPGL